jgi:hypothetical protein
MKKGIQKLLGAALLISAAGVIASCGTGGDSISMGDTPVETASLKIAVKFPDSGINPTYIDNDVSCIQVEYSKGDIFKEVTLTRDNPTATIEKLVPGSSLIKITATNGLPDNDGEYQYCTGDILDKVNVKAYLKEGENQLKTILIAPAKWEFVDNDDNPVSIVFNKLKTDSLEEITSFVLSVNSYGPIPASLDFTKLAGKSFYKVAFYGNNLNPIEDNDAGSCVYQDGEIVCYTEGIYFNQFVGPNTSSNTFEAHEVPLAPMTIDNDQVKRFFIVLGSPPNYMEDTDVGYNKEFSVIQDNDNTDVAKDVETRFGFTKVVDALHMEGTILEVAVKGENKEIICSFDTEGNDIIPCPENIGDETFIGPMSISISNEGISTQAIDNDNCYRDVSMVEKRYIDYLHSPFRNCEPTTPFYCDYNMDGVINDNDDMNGDNDVNQLDNYYIIETTNMPADICVYPFRAKATSFNASATVEIQ